MIHIEEKMMLITPCFCAGADQEKAELRAPAIRGQLRWWFRVLGGTSEQEKDLFGGVHDGTKASRIIIRIKDVVEKQGNPSDLPSPNKPLYYLFHFARVSGTRKRYEANGWLKEGTAFTVEIFSRLPMSEEQEKQFLMAWNAFVKFGGLGLRQTRGLGSFSSEQLLEYNKIKQELHELGKYGIYSWFIGEMNGQPAFRKTWRESLLLLEAALGHIRQHGFKSDKATPLGGGGRMRQASALHLRPVLVRDGFLPLLYYAPQVLAPQNTRSHTQLLELLNSNIPCKVPYMQAPKQPDDRDEYRIIPL